MKIITSNYLSDKNNHTTCECGNKTIYDYSWISDNGSVSCPSCMAAWQGQQIRAMKELVYEVSSKSNEETAEMINKRYAKIMDVDMEYFTDMEYDFSDFKN